MQRKFALFLVLLVYCSDYANAQKVERGDDELKATPRDARRHNALVRALLATAAKAENAARISGAEFALRSAAANVTHANGSFKFLCDACQKYFTTFVGRVYIDEKNGCLAFRLKDYLDEVDTITFNEFERAVKVSWARVSAA